MAGLRELGVVMVGGGLGSVARHLVSAWMLERFGAAFPWGTLTVNVLGSLILGAVAQAALNPALLGPEARLFLATGLMGGFTTWSTFNLESLRLAQDGAFGGAALYVGSSLLLSAGAGLLGMAGAKAIFG